MTDTPAEAPRLLSIVMPVYNEAAFVQRVIERVEAVDLPAGLDRQLIIVDDASTDGTREILQKVPTSAQREIHFHPVNQGKGAALATGFQAARGDYVIIQDADLEYDPQDYGRLLRPMLDGRADVVYGSRFLGGEHRVLYYWHSVANYWLTTLSNMFTNLNLTDMECGYKLFRREILERITVEEPRFGFEPEITAKVAKLGARIFEVPINYAGRTYEEGKKIGWRDGLSALRCILQYNLQSTIKG
jgi:glycosyltransferase involved in cell wall biosynthesis